jgi:hypothetical protein
MTTIAKLLAQKQRLLEQLQEDPGPHVREEIERLLAEIDAELNQLDEMAERMLSAFRLSPMASRSGQRAAPVVVSEEGLAAGGGAWLTAVDPGIPLGPGLLATCVVFHDPHASIATASMTTAITANVRKCMRLSALVSNPDFKLSWRTASGRRRRC